MWKVTEKSLNFLFWGLLYSTVQCCGLAPGSAYFHRKSDNAQAFIFYLTVTGLCYSRITACFSYYPRCLTKLHSLTIPALFHNYLWYWIASLLVNVQILDSSRLFPTFSTVHCRKVSRELSTRAFEAQTATGSELFSLLTCPQTTTFTLL